ncbi:hypothetical protein HanIR_Chr13g0639071 [Helianthus annuus]|nr:hypothetical protein HanIR_Chr13g0639071 [Helianthus annuus]
MVAKHNLSYIKRVASGRERDCFWRTTTVVDMNKNFTGNFQKFSLMVLPYNVEGAWSQKVAQAVYQVARETILLI